MTSGQCGEISASGVSRVAEHEEPACTEYFLTTFSDTQGANTQ